MNDPDGDKSAADRGTLGHKATELEKPELASEDVQLKAAVENCIKYKRAVAATYAPGYKMFQEVKLPYFDQWGFCDVLITDADRADLIDWKFTFNEHEADSPQFWAYFIGVLDKFPQVQYVTVHVPMPFLGIIDTETFTRKEHYKQFRVNVQAIVAAQAANDPTKFRITDQCAFCGFARKCSKMAALGLEIGRRYAADLELPTGTLHGSEVKDPNIMAALLKLARPVKKAAEGWGKAGLEMYDAGTNIPGFKLMTKKGNRSVASALKAYQIIKENFDPNLTLEKFLEYCEIGATTLDEIVEKTAPPRGKAAAVKMLAAHLEDNDALDYGGSGRFLKATKEGAPDNE